MQTPSTAMIHTHSAIAMSMKATLVSICNLLIILFISRDNFMGLIGWKIKSLHMIWFSWVELFVLAGVHTHTISITKVHSTPAVVLSWNIITKYFFAFTTYIVLLSLYLSWQLSSFSTKPLAYSVVRYSKLSPNWLVCCDSIAYCSVQFLDDFHFRLSLHFVCHYSALLSDKAFHCLRVIMVCLVCFSPTNSTNIW